MHQFIRRSNKDNPARETAAGQSFPAPRTQYPLYLNIHISIRNPGMSPGCPLTTTKYHHSKKSIFNHGPLSASHSNLMFFLSFFSERSGQRRPPAERSALYQHTISHTVPQHIPCHTLTMYHTIPTLYQQTPPERLNHPRTERVYIPTNATRK